MLLQFPNGEGEPFATGAIGYQYRPVTENETTNRLLLQVDVENVLAEAVLDTGAPYSIIVPRIARMAGLNQVKPLERITMLVRGMRLEGKTIRLGMTLRAEVGENLTVDVEEYWGEFPSFIGQNGFLDRIRYAVDSSTDMFYFGELP